MYIVCVVNVLGYDGFDEWVDFFVFDCVFVFFELGGVDVIGYGLVL